MCVILSTGGGLVRGGVPPNFRRGGGSGPGGVPPNFGGGLVQGGVPPNFRGGGSLQFFGGGSPLEYGQCSAGTHPTGMHSCWWNVVDIDCGVGTNFNV